MAPDAPAQSERKPNRLAAHQLLPVSEIFSTPPVKIELTKLTEIAGLLWMPEGTSEDEQNAKLMRAVDLFESIKPESGIEAMLATQMVGTHHAALECLRRAMVPNQTFEGRQASLNQAHRLMNLYTQQLAALDRHRGKGQQKITVERVQIAAGGQAIVGHVEPNIAPAPSPPPVALPDGRKNDAPLPVAKASAKVRR